MINNVNNHHVVISGAGPVGDALACMIKVLYKGCKVTVYDKRPDPAIEANAKKLRTHGLRIAADSVKLINQVLQTAIASQDPYVDRENAKDLIKHFKSWNGNFLRTHHIQAGLAEKAKRLGVEIIYNESITQEDFKEALDKSNDQSDSLLTKKQQDLQQAQLIIGCDGSRSEIRQALFGEELAHKQLLHHLVEMKFDTEDVVKPRGLKVAAFHGSVCDENDFESISKSKGEEIKPATLHQMIDLETYNHLRPTQINNGKEELLKGDVIHPWNLKELKKAGKTDKKIRKVYSNLMHYIENLNKRGGTCQNVRISTLPLEIYRSPQAAVEYKGKFVLLAGDSHAGLIFERGFNKGLMEAALCAQAVKKHFYLDSIENKSKHVKKKYKQIDRVDGLTKPLRQYNQQTKNLYEKEKWWIVLKNSALVSYKNLLHYAITPIAKRIRNSFYFLFKKNRSS